MILSVLTSILSEAPHPQRGASRARSGEQNASQENIIYIVPLDPAYKAGLAGHLPAAKLKFRFLFNRKQRGRQGFEEKAHRRA